MSTVAEHYAGHLAAVCTWMSGGIEAALQAGSAELDALGLSLQGRPVLDLGAGFGMHAIPLARRGAQVTAIDTSAQLLGTLRELRGELPIHIVEDDLMAFDRHVAGPVAAAFCLGDTITHLPDFAAVEGLIDKVAFALQDGGEFVLSFRDYSEALRGDRRFIPVRSDDDRILTCFLEYGSDRVEVHDILHERSAGEWRMRVSHYTKLRLPPPRLIASLEARGFSVRREAGLRGMVRLVAKRGLRPAACR